MTKDIIYDIYSSYDNLGTPLYFVVAERDSKYRIEFKLYESDESGELKYLSNLTAEEAASLIDEGLAERL